MSTAHTCVQFYEHACEVQATHMLHVMGILICRTESFCRVRPDTEQAALLVERLASHASASSRLAVQPALVANAAQQVGRSFPKVPCWPRATGQSESPAACLSHRTFHYSVPRQRSISSSLPSRAAAPPSSSGRSFVGHVGRNCGRAAIALNGCAMRARGGAEIRRGFAAMSCSGASTAIVRGHATWSGNAAVQAVRGWNSQAVAAYTPKLPGWVRSRLPEMPEGAHSAVQPLSIISCESSFGRTAFLQARCIMTRHRNLPQPEFPDHLFLWERTFEISPK